MSAQLAVSTLSRDEARSLTGEVKGDAERLWRKLVELYEGKAHLALGYSSWGAYFKNEFGGSQAQAYKLLDAGRVVEAIAGSTNVERLPTKEQARELAPLRDDAVAIRETWASVIEDNPEPTAREVRQAVQERRLTMPMRAELVEQQQRRANIAHLDRCLRGFEVKPGHARAEIDRLLSADDPHAFTSARFEQAAEAALAYADALKKRGL